MTKILYNNLHHIEQYVIDAITTLRKKKSMSAKEIGLIIDTSSSFVLNVESHRNAAKYNLKHIYKIATHFGKSPRYFLPK